MNFLVESWHKVITSSSAEAIIDHTKHKNLAVYQQIMGACFREFFRILKPGRWITVGILEFPGCGVEFDSINASRSRVRCGQCRCLDKQQRSFRSVTSPTAVKGRSLVISAYKPNGGFWSNASKKVEHPGGSLGLHEDSPPQFARG